MNLAYFILLILLLLLLLTGTFHFIIESILFVTLEVFFFPCLPPWEPCRPCSYLVTPSCSCFPLVSCTYHPVRARLFLFGLYVALNLSLLKGFSPRKLGTKGIYETNVGKGVILLYLGPWK